VAKGLSDRCDKLKSQKEQLVESLNEREDAISELNKKIGSLNGDIQKVTQKSSARIHALEESLEETKKEIGIAENRHRKEKEQYKKLVEQYKEDSKKDLDKYIDQQALRLDVSSSEIKNRLNESYTFDDVDAICESLRSYSSNMNKLPLFNVSRGSRVRITEQADPLV